MNTVNGTGTLTIGNGTNATVLHINQGAGGSSQSAVIVSAGSTLDLNNDHFFINYGSNPDPISSIVALIESGYNAGAWNGLGIDSSAATTNNSNSSNPQYGIGYADSSDPGNPAGLASGQIEIMYTLLGDANLDGVVNAIDFGILAANFNKGVTGWDKGDFNYDNVVSAIDFGELAANFNKGASGASIGPGALSDPALVAFAEANGLMANVPEPVSMGLFAAGAVATLARRRRRAL
jgi:hypothetical protein